MRDFLISGWVEFVGDFDFNVMLLPNGVKHGYSNYHVCDETFSGGLHHFDKEVFTFSYQRYKGKYCSFRYASPKMLLTIKELGGFSYLSFAEQDDLDLHLDMPLWLYTIPGLNIEENHEKMCKLHKWMSENTLFDLFLHCYKQSWYCYIRVSNELRFRAYGNTIMLQTAPKSLVQQKFQAQKKIILKQIKNRKIRNLLRKRITLILS